MTLDSWLTCINGCEVRYSPFDIRYTCEDCGSLLGVVHDLTALKKKSAQEWKTTFESRNNTGKGLNSSGVWSRQEWVLPQIQKEYIISLGEGNTPLVPIPRSRENFGVDDLRLKQSGTSHTGSFKDLGMTVLVSTVNQIIGQGGKIQAIAAASTGDTSAALAAYAAGAGIPAVILLPRGKISPAQLIQPVANGALVLALETDFDGCMALVRKLTGDPEIYLANSLNSLRIEGQKTVAMEIVQQLGWQVPDWIVIPAGNLGNVSALGQGLTMMYELGLIDNFPRIACTQAANANPLYLSFQKGFRDYQPVNARSTAASAIQIGDPVSYPRAVQVLRDFEGVVEQATEEELANAAALADRSGMYTCPQTGVALAGVKKLVHKGIIQEDQQVVVVSTAHGLKFTNFKVDYHFGDNQGLDRIFRNQVVEIDPSVEAVKRAVQKRFS
jgi:threonine synthase